ncbi:hypothetical protein [Pseudonocardia endophytica]|uniref:AAA+ ATPase domain-containing protein n=1 Tax=Pseudonocardia endophytica TaxID=401976 RepID=A0A4V2PIH2_PSEEN|nr:hypothetical protein [Pseudonocardia endophytica]TCK24576.1 hypothetical protein EV378_0350 [Pseudonocardia endophytica]
MRLTARGVGVDGPHGTLLEPTDVDVARGDAVLVAGMPGTGHTALALALGGRMAPHRGRVLVDGADDPAALRRRVAVVDTPGVSEPEPALTLGTVVGEELAMAGRRAWRRQVADWLGQRAAGEWSGRRFEDVPADVRIDLMLALAATRPAVDVVVLTGPDRHGGSPHTWWRMARNCASTGYAVVVTCADTSAAVLDVPCFRIGAGTAEGGPGHDGIAEAPAGGDGPDDESTVGGRS